MMVTVKERTTEIGIRRAIGARPKDILQQILSESMVLTTIAGMCGISFAVMVLQLVEMGANADGGRHPFSGYLRTGNRHLCSSDRTGNVGRSGTCLSGHGYQTD